MRQGELKDFLEEKVNQYNQPRFIETDPISIPHRFSGKEDREIAGFLAATIAWGQRPVILKNALRLLEWMDFAPLEFILHHREVDLKRMDSFVHRTFNYSDLLFFMSRLQGIYRQHGGLEGAFTGESPVDARQAIINFREIFFAAPHLPRTQKHVSNPLINSSCKRLNMFLRWMVRHDEGGVDFGIWKGISPARLSCPLDIHSGNVARKLGLLKRKANDWKAVDELDRALRKLDAQDPVKYDFALFGLGVFEKF